MKHFWKLLSGVAMLSLLAAHPALAEVKLRDGTVLPEKPYFVVTYIEVARQEYWRAFTNDQNYKSVPFILARVEVDFRSEALMHEMLELCIRCSYIGGKSFGFEYAIRELTSRRLIVAARSVQVMYDYTTKTSVPFPPELKLQLEAFEGRSLDREVRS